MKLGIDIIEICRIEKAIQKSERFLKRVYTEREIQYCESKGTNRFHSYAGIYAAKEAILKALGTGLREGAWQDLEISHDELGAPIVTLSGVFADKIRSMNLRDVIISISHCKEYAMSTAIIKE